MHLASIFGHLEIVKALIAAGADVDVKDDQGETPLQYASSKGYLEIVEVLQQALEDQNPIKEPNVY